MMSQAPGNKSKAMTPKAKKLPTGRPMKGAKDPSQKQRLAVARTSQRRMPGGRADKLERQAEHLATKIADGETSVARYLTPAAAARYYVPGSRGEALPWTLRSEFENAFGADLGAVRIHRNEAAGSAARKQRAIAFAAGRDIFFAPGAYQPFNPQGLRLIAHELVHVLQQTGRTGSDGTVHATTASGSGEIQRAWESPLGEVEEPTMFRIFEVHEAAWLDAESKDEIAKLKTGINTASDGVVFWAERAAKIIGGVSDPLWGVSYKDLHVGGLSCLYDALKFAEEWDAAIKILHDREDVQTLWFHKVLYEKYAEKFGIDHILERMYKVWAVGSYFNGARPADIMDALVEYLLGPTRAISRKDIGTDVKMKAEVSRRRDKVSPVENELYFISVYAISEFENARYKTVQAAEQNTSGHKAQRKLDVALQLQNFANSLILEPSKYLAETQAERGIYLETARIMVDFAPALLNASQLAIQFYQLSERLGGKAVDPEFGVAGEELVKTLSDDDFFKPFPEALLKLAEGILALPEAGGLPDAAAYQQQVTTARNEFVVAIWQNFERKLADMFKPMFDKETKFSFPAEAWKKVDRKRLARISWVLVRASGVLFTVDQYKEKEDDDYVKRIQAIDPADPGLDYRLAHRIRVARAISNVASLPNYTTVLERVAPVMIAREKTKSWSQDDQVVALLGTWELDAAAPIERLRADQGTQDIAGWAPLTVDQVVTFYQTQNYQTFSKHIDDLIGKEKGTYPAEGDMLLNRAYEAAMAEERPRRYKMTDWERAFDEENAKERSTAQFLIRTHPLTQGLVADERTRLGHEPALIVPVNQMLEAVVWLLPPPILLVQKLREVEEVNVILHRLQRSRAIEMLDDEGQLQVQFLDPYTLDQIKALSWDVWWDLLQEALTPTEAELKMGRKKAMEDRRKKIDEVRGALDASGLDAKLGIERDLAYKGLEDDVRAGLSHERRRRVEVTWRPMLTAYDPSASASDLVKVNDVEQSALQLPISVIEGVMVFQMNATGQEDRDAHLAMALIELSDLLETKLATNLTRDLLFYYVPAIDAALERHAQGGLEQFLAPADATNTTMIPEGIKRLEDLLNGPMKEALEKLILEFGLVGTGGDGTIEDTGSVNPLGSGRTFDFDKPFVMDGIHYQITEVVESFTFHPGAWPIRWKQKPDAKGGSLLRLGDEEELRDDSKRTGRVLLRVVIGEGTAPVDVKDTDSALLTDLTWKVTRAAQVEGMTELGEGIEAVGNFAMDVAELFPGVGPAVAATRLVATIGTFLDQELDELLEELITNPADYLKELLSELSSRLTVTSVLDFLLLQGDGFSIKKRRKPKKAVSGSARTKTLRRISERMQTIGLGLLNSFGRLQTRVANEREGLQMLVLGTPMLVRMVNLLADYYWVLQSLPSMLSEAADFQKHGQAFVDKTQETLNALGQIELPGTIITFEDIINLVLDVVANKLGGKYKIAVQVVWSLIDLVGARQWLVDRIAAGIRSLGVDDKKILPGWDDVLGPDILKALGDAQQEMRTHLNEVLTMFNSAAGTSLQIGEVGTNVIDTGSEFPETAPFGGEPGSDEPPLPDFSQGRPLAPRVRSEAEARFGHDFSHVRVHTGAGAERANKTVGSYALTSGSHIFLRGGTPDRPLAQDRVMRHELAHVVQQTGSRPLGSTPDPRPRPGSPGVGIRFDRGAEAGANRAADAAARGPAAAPMAVDGAGSTGLQPLALEELGHRFLRYLTGFEKIAGEVEEIDKTGAGKGARLIARNVRDAVSGVGEALKSHFIKAKLTIDSYKGTFGPVKDDISAHLKNQEADLVNAIEDLAIEASEPVPGPAAGATKKPKMRLNVHKFSGKLNRYVFGKTGILLDIQLDTKGHGRDATLVKATPVKSVGVKFVFLAPIDSNSNLWIKALQYKSSATGKTLLTEDERKELRPRVRQALRAMGPGLHTWVDGEYRLHHAVFDKVEKLKLEEATAGTAGFLPAANLPVKSEYLAPKGTADKGGFGHVGLRIGTYEQRNTDQSQKGRERESHHITQYLVAAYLHCGQDDVAATNANERAFKLDMSAEDDLYPGVKSKGNVVKEFDSGGKQVKIGKLEKGRGGSMPVILLARPTHRTGGLHITPSADDFSDPPATTQAGAVNNVFRKALPPEYKQAEEEAASKKDLSYWKAYRDKPGHDIAAQINSAIQATYKVVRNYMQPRLLDALKVQEREYYHDLAKSGSHAGSNYEISETEMGDVYKAAKRANHEGLEKDIGLTGEG